MEQILLHLLGDYVTQTNKMATKKTGDSWWALMHAVVYATPFLLLGSLSAAAVIMASHFAMDRFRLAKYVVYAKNLITEPKLRWEDCSLTGYHRDVPAWMSVWLMIAADNTLHLCINWAALRWM